MTSAIAPAIDTNLRNLVADQLAVERDDIVPETSLVDDLAADSLDLVELALALEADLHIALPGDVFDHVRTFGDLVAAIAELQAQLEPRAPACRDWPDPLVRSRIVTPAGTTVVMCSGILTPYAAEEIGAQALHAGHGACLELTATQGTSEAVLDALRARFAPLAERGIVIDVHRDDAVDRPGLPPRAA